MENYKWEDNMSAGATHRFLLLKALEQTKGKVVELGCGTESTPYLREYCKDNNREFVSYENHKEWSERWGAKFVNDWDEVVEDNISVLFIDHSPPERRGYDLQRFKDKADIIVCHDTEGGGYKYDMSNFKYKEEHELLNTKTTLLKYK